ncbi:redoxin domain-containing protein [Halorubrum sp. DTA46]|uniref:redoxin domain-containing protein n=1 Tax=Halorubrum sp. DTA46 TaxID=3402162 RepID=UPI003AAED616
MIHVDKAAPDFTVPKAGGEAYDDVEPFTLSSVLGDGPVVLAFVPAAFTGGCTEEMCSFRNSMADFEAVDARVYGISVDLPYAQNVWMREEGLNFPMLSDTNRDVIHAYDVVLDAHDGLFETAERAIVVIDAAGQVSATWIREDGNPDFEALVSWTRDAVREAVAR